jgi:sodium-dependent dicarboxylate transporter 2/3/5
MVVFALAAIGYLACALPAWHAQESVRRAAGVVLAVLILWISEAAPLGVTALVVPIAATFTGLLPWKEAVAAWGDPVVFLFLGAFLLARALEKHGVFEWVMHLRWAGRRETGSAGIAFVILMVSGVLSTVQNNTAVTAMLLPLVMALARRTPAPFAGLLALAWGATFGGMATPVGTAPNFIGYSAMKRLDESVTFVYWLRVGMPVWLGTTLIGWAVLAAAARRPAWRRLPAAGPTAPDPENLHSPALARAASTPAERRWVIAAFAAAVILWLLPALVISATTTDHPAAIWLRTYLPESLVPIAVAWVLFFLRPGPARRPLLEPRDFQALDWDTLFLIAGGLALGRMLETSGAAGALAEAVSGASLPSAVLMLLLAGTTVVLSELTSNTATASLMVPIAGSLAGALQVSPVQAVWLVSLAASLGFALPVSTPPNAMVYGTRMVPLRVMAVTGLILDLLATLWLVCCIRWWG